MNNVDDVHKWLSDLHWDYTREDRMKRQVKIKRRKEMKQFKEEWHIALAFIVGLLLLFALFGCTTPSITIYQQGESVGNGTIVVREMLNLNVVERVYEGKAKIGKVIVRRELE